MLLRLARFFSSMLSQFLKKLVALQYFLRRHQEHYDVQGQKCMSQVPEGAERADFGREHQLNGSRRFLAGTVSREPMIPSMRFAA